MSSKAHDATEGCSKKETAASAPSQKPTRPLTAYHLFFQLEREYILQTTHGEDGGATITSNPTKDDRPIGKQIDDRMPFRYRYINLSPQWYASGSGKRTDNEKNQGKRRHRKTHGKISFLDLSKCIAARWAELEEKDKSIKMYVRSIAARELDIYKKEMNLFKAKMELVVPEKNMNSSICNSCVPRRHSTPIDMPLKAGDVVGKISPLSWTSAKMDAVCVQTSRRASAEANADGQVDASAKRTEEDEEIGVISSKDCIGKDSSAEFSFHPIPSSFWKKYRKSAKKGSRRYSYGYDAPSRVAKMSPHSVMTKTYAPYCYSRQDGMPTQHRQSCTPVSPHIGRHSGVKHTVKFDLTPQRDNRSDSINLGNEMVSLSRAKRDHPRMPVQGNPTGPPSQSPAAKAVAAMEFTSDDAAGLIKALSEDDN